ncbi:MAG: lysoplasmalogenase [Clostridiales bacterium]|nr:lysoplasmalogenase [Clostridiales bacterium]
MSLYLSVFVIALSAGLAIFGKYKRQKFIHYAFKPLTMLLILSLAWERALSSPSFYGYLVVSGLGLSLLGDIFLMLPRDRIKPGLAAFLAAHILYVIAFSQGIPIRSFGVAVPVLILGAIVYAWIFRNIGGLRLPVLVYILVISALVWVAINRYLSLAEGKSLLVMVGAPLFFFSDAVLAVNRFHKKFFLADILILSTYFSAQLCFALSI